MLEALQVKIRIHPYRHAKLRGHRNVKRLEIRQLKLSSDYTQKNANTQANILIHTDIYENLGSMWRIFH